MKNDNDIESHKIYYVYALLDPRKEPSCLLLVLGQKIPYEIFYVGKGKNNRYKAHFKNDTKNDHKRNTIKAIRDCGLEPIVIFIKNNMLEYHALSLESSIIRQMGRKNFNNGPLTNKTDGMDGCKNITFTEETRKKMRISAFNRAPITKEIKINMSIAQRKRSKPTEKTKSKCSLSLSEALTIVISPKCIIELTMSLDHFCFDHGLDRRTFVRHQRLYGSYLGWKFIKIKIHHRKEKIHKNWFELGKILFDNGIDLKEYGRHRI